jgi:hypothetical protein
MRNKLLIPIFIVILISLACGPTPATPTPVPPTPVPTQPPPPTPEPTKAPTATRVPTPEQPVQEELPPTEEIPQQPEAPAYYTEEFDVAGAPNWLYYVISGSIGDNDIYTDNGKLVFSLGDRDAWANFLYDPWIYEDVQISTLVTNRGTNNYFYGLVTRYTDTDGFYMFLVNPGGMYGIWRYDALTDTYAQIRTGGSNSVRQGKDRNEITAITVGDRLELIINGRSIWTANDKNLREGQVGLTMIGLGTTPLIAEFDYVDISKP